MENKDLREFMQGTFDSYEPEPSRDLWEGIENVIQPKRKKIGRWPVLWPYLVAAAAAILLLIALGIWSGDPNQGTKSPAVVEQKSSPENPVTPKNQFVPEVPQEKEIVENTPSTPNKTIQKEPEIATVSLNQSASPQQTKSPNLKQVTPVVPETREEIAISTPKKPLSPPVMNVLEDKPEIALSEEELAANIAPTPLKIDQPAEPIVKGGKREINLNKITGQTLTAFANSRLEKFQVPSPVEVVEEEFSNGKQKSVKVGFKLFNITHKRHKQYIIKKPDV